MSADRPMNRPNSVILRISPSTSEPIGWSRQLLPRVALHLLEAERNPPFGAVDVEDHDVHFLAGRNDLAGMDVLLRPGHFGHVHQALDPRLQLHEGAVVGDVGDPAGEPRARRIFGGDAFPGIGFQLLHAERDALGVGVEADDLDLDRWPMTSASLGWLMRRQAMSVTCSRPSTPPRSTKAP